MPREFAIEVVRSLTEEDIPQLTAPANTKPIPIQTLRASHHNLAQLLAQGRSETEVALISGYSLSRISILKGDPSFQQLMAGYQEVRNSVFADTLDRMRILGLSTLDELQERLESAPEHWSNRELMEMANLMLVKPGQNQSAGANPNPGAGVTLNVQFIKSQTPALELAPRGDTLTIDAEGEGEP